MSKTSRSGVTVRSLSICAAVLSGSLWAQGPAEPTSVAVNKTLLAVFEPATGPCELVSEETRNNFRLLLHYDGGEGAKASVALAGVEAIALPPGEGRAVEIAYEQVPGRAAVVRVWQDGEPVAVGAGADREEAEPAPAGIPHHATREESAATFRMDRDFTAMVVFRTTENGTLVAKAPPEGDWARDAKALFLRNGRLTYDIGWLGQIDGRTRVNDGKPHVAVLTMSGEVVKLYVDGKLEAEKKGFTRPDVAAHVFKVGEAAPDFGGDFAGTLQNVRFWKRALSEKEIGQLSSGQADAVNTPDFNWLVPEGGSESVAVGTTITVKAGKGFTLRQALLQSLASADHQALVKGWDRETYERGKVIYGQLCVTCHGTLEKPGSLPTALRFHEGQFKNGYDPYRMFQTLEKGYGQMVPQPQYTTQQKYDVIHYVREEFLKEKNPSQYGNTNPAYLASLPRGRTLEKEKAAPRPNKPYLAMDFGNVLFWTLQVEEGNIAQKGIAVRVDAGPGGISKGKAWMLYDHDTMRLAACWTGDKFVDWRGIAFDGSHGTHTSIVGEKAFVFPNEPQWANPETGDFEDLRIRGRDGKPYGPLPREWVDFAGLKVTEANGVLGYSVGDRQIGELPQWDGARGVFVRLLYVGPSKQESVLRLGKDEVHKIAASEEWQIVRIEIADGVASVKPGRGEDRAAFEAGEIRRFPGVLVTEIEKGADEGPFAVDVLTPPAPAGNPWQSWMRTSGFDFFEGGKSAAVCTWNGDVWIVDGIDQSEGTLVWQRICAGLFQPLGVKIVEGEIFVGCRDMIAKLMDTNGDRETDYIEAFNHDHQVTEHFHEFAMGLQTDAEGNFFYAKSARHALKAVVPHHGTLLKVSKDGMKTTILATGFRAANGVCLNPDGTFIVTDQEGHWNPKNRINWVKGDGVNDFYGNMYGYHSITDDSDEAMTPPLCWITNSFDRSPAELLWVPEDSAWETLRGSLLNLSYGYGKVYVVPHEKVNGQVQGGMCQLPFKQFPTGVMRGRFHPGDGQLYACGMFAWAGSQNQPGGFYRIRYTGVPAHAPVGLSTAKRTVKVTFTDALDRDSAGNPKAWTIEAWDLKRTRNYGSKHYNQRKWPVENASLSADGKTVTLTIPDLAPTWGMSISCKIRGAKGEMVERVIHNSIHALGE